MATGVPDHDQPEVHVEPRQTPAGLFGTLKISVAPIARLSCRLAASRGFTRITAAAAAVSFWLALYWAATAADTSSWDSEQNRRDASHLALVWASAGAMMIILRAITSWRRRRHATGSEIIRLASQFAPHRPRWQRPVHLVLAFIGYVLLWLGIIAAAVAYKTALTFEVELAALFVIKGAALLGALITIPAGMIILRYSRPRAAKGGVETLLADVRTPVLYLRSFSDDQEGAVVDPRKLAPPQAAQIQSREEDLAALLDRFGPVITAGRPQERLPMLGAARFYLPPDAWRPTVARIMDIAKLVVIRLGEGEGLWWEFAHAVRHLPPSKVIVLVPALPVPAGLMQRMDLYLPVPSDLDAAAARSSDSWTSAVVCFDPSWRPHVTPVGAPPGKKPHRAPWLDVARALQASLAAVGIRRRGLVWSGTWWRPLVGMGKFLLVIAMLVPLLVLLDAIYW
jgi:hypothetical protein